MCRYVPIILLAFFLLIARNGADSQSYSPDRVQTINNIFEIPIQTLNAIKKFVQGTRPLGTLIRNPQQQQQQQQQQQLQRPTYSSSYFVGQQRPYTSQSSGTNQYYNYNRYSNNNKFRSRAARIAGLYIAPDGSGFKI